MTEPRSTRTILVTFFTTAIVFSFVGYFTSQRFALKDAAEPVFAKTKDLKIFARDVMPLIEAQVIEHEKAIYRLKRNATEELILKETKSVTEPTETLSKEVEVSDAELQAWSVERGLRLGRLTAKQREDLVANYKIHQRLRRQNSDRTKLLRQSGVEWLLPVPYRRQVAKVEPGQLTVFKSDPARDRVILFGNFHCGNCTRLQEKMRELAESVGGGLSISLRFDIQPGDSPIVSRTARAAICAQAQNKFSEFFEMASRFPPTDIAALQKIVIDLNLDLVRFESCADDKATEARLKEDLAEAQRISPAGLPFAVVKEYVIPLQEPIDEYLLLLGH